MAVRIVTDGQGGSNTISPDAVERDPDYGPKPSADTVRAEERKLLHAINGTTAEIKAQRATEWHACVRCTWEGDQCVKCGRPKGSAKNWRPGTASVAPASATPTAETSAPAPATDGSLAPLDASDLAALGATQAPPPPMNMAALEEKLANLEIPAQAVAPRHPFQHCCTAIFGQTARECVLGCIRRRDGHKWIKDPSLAPRWATLTPGS